MSSKTNMPHGQYLTAARSPTTPGTDGARAQRYAEAKALGFGLESCGECGNLTLVRNGACLRCLTCGSTSGCS